MTTAAAIEETFQAIAERSPVFASTEHGKGFLPPLFRAYGHALYLSGWQAESEKKRPSNDQVTETLTEGLTHLTQIPDTQITEESKTRLANVIQAWEAVAREFTDWDAATRLTNFVTLANLIMLVLVRLDRELLGLRDSDMGSRF